MSDGRARTSSQTLKFAGAEISLQGKERDPKTAPNFISGIESEYRVARLRPEYHEFSP